MAIEKGVIFATRDVYIDYPYEKAMFRWDHKEKKIYVKFYGADELPEQVPYEDFMFNQALLSGEEITREEYLKGKKID